MKTGLFLVPALACAAFAATEEEVAAQLSRALQHKVELLAGVQDAASAAAAVEPVRQVLAELASLNTLVNETSLWNYIDSTEGVKPLLIDSIQRLTKEFSRLEEARFYGCKELHALLAPQLNRAEPPRSAR